MLAGSYSALQIGFTKAQCNCEEKVKVACTNCGCGAKVSKCDCGTKNCNCDNTVTTSSVDTYAFESCGIVVKVKTPTTDAYSTSVNSQITDS
jgi:hypothetical protein